MTKIQPQKLSDAITERLQTMIFEGHWGAGQRLPSERDLSTQFEVSRPSLREAIQNLVGRGLVERRQGGGTYVTGKFANQLHDPLLSLIEHHPEAQYDLLEFRHSLEGVIVHYAALRGSQEDKEALEETFASILDIQETGDIDSEAKALTKFYQIMAQSTHNSVFIHVIRGLLPLLLDNIRRNLLVLQQVADSTNMINQHRRKILDAVLAKKPEQAREYSNQLLQYIDETLQGINRNDSQMQRALRRLPMA
jgi:GntR family transcriptional repressor for pyruvate dehydrogenase complex